MALEIELGVWIFMNVVAIAGFYVTIKHGFGIVLLLSFILFAGQAVWFIGGETTVVQTKQIPSVNSTNSIIERNGSGSIISNSSEASMTPSYSEKRVIINSDQSTIGYVYFLAAGVALTWVLKIILAMFRTKNRIKASGYWT